MAPGCDAQWLSSVGRVYCTGGVFATDFAMNDEYCVCMRFVAYTDVEKLEVEKEEEELDCR